MHPKGMTSGVVRVKLSETPGNPAFALRQVYDVLMSFTDPLELLAVTLETVEPFNPRGKVRAVVQEAVEGQAGGVLSDDEMAGLVGAALGKGPKGGAKAPRTKVSTGMSVDHFARMRDTLEQIAWSDERDPLLGLQKYITNFILAADGEGVVGGHKANDREQDRWQGPGAKVVKNRPRNRFASSR